MLCCKHETAIYPTAITMRCLEITREIRNILCEPLMYNIVLQEIWFTDFPLPVVLNFPRFSHNNPKLWHTDDYMHVIMYGIQSNPCKNSNCSGLEGFYRWGSVSFPSMASSGSWFPTPPCYLILIYALQLFSC